MNNLSSVDEDGEIGSIAHQIGIAYVMLDNTTS
jgi:hypothetical protein